MQEEEREQPIPAERSSDKVDRGDEASEGEGHDLLHSGIEKQSVSPTPRLAKVGKEALITSKLNASIVLILV